jgi:hypothetical protein
MALKSKTIILFLFLAIVCYEEARASHAIGAEISYAYQSGTTYLVTVYCYRDCNGIPLSGTDLNATDGSKSLLLTASKCCGKDITPVCSSSCDRCTDLSCSVFFGVQRWTVTAKLDASYFSNCTIKLYWDESAVAYTSNATNGGQDLYIETKLNRCYAEHSSPQFQFNPRILLCKNAPVEEFVTAGYGTLNDSISYHFAKPPLSGGGYIGYNTPFSYLSPLTYPNSPAYYNKKPQGFHYDSTSGEFYFKPAKVESTFMGWEVDQYLKDSTGKYYLAGNTVRISEMIVLACDSNHVPSITSPDKYSADTIITCANEPVNFTVKTSDADSKDNVNLTALNETSGTVSISTASRPAATFSWLPKNSEVRKLPYAITFTAADDKCPFYGMVQKRVWIFVQDSLPVTGIALKDSGCGKYFFSLKYPVDKNYNVSYKWFIDNKQFSTLSAFSYRNNQAGMHIANLEIKNKSGCIITYADTFVYDAAYQKLVKDTTICKGDNLQLTAAKGSNLKWQPSKGLSDSTIYNPVAHPDTTTTYTVSGTDANGCAYTDRTKINIINYNLKLSGNNVICNGTALKLYVNHYTGMTNSWQPASYISQIYGDSIISYPGKNTLYKVTATLKGCIRKDSLQVQVNPTSIDYGPTKYACQGDSITLHAGPGSSYKWIDQVHVVVLGVDSVYKFLPTNFINGYHFEITLKDKNTGCPDTGFMTVKLISFNPYISSYTDKICFGNTETIAASGGNKLVWNISGVGSSYINPLTFTPSVSTMVTGIISDTSTGCSRTYKLPVYVSPKSSMYPSKSICQGDTVQLSAGGGSSYKWSPSTGLNNTIIAKPEAYPSSTTKYTVAIKDSATGCTRVDTVNVMIDTDCIWPGDANKDKTADYLDVLSIGLGYGAKGPARAPGTLKWKQYHADNWNTATSSGINFKYIDCNGDGIIDNKDTAIVSLNYGKKHAKWIPGTGNPNNPEVYFKFVKDTFYAGDTAIAYLYAGSKSKPLSNAYGIGYQASFMGWPVIYNTARYSAFCEYFCSGKEINYIRPSYLNHSFEGTAVETNGISNPSTYGRIGILKFALKDSNSYNYPELGEKIYAVLNSATAIDKTGQELSIYGLNGTALVLKRYHGLGVKNADNKQGIRIYPNPATNEVIIENAGGELQNIGFYNNLGQCIYISYTNDPKKVMDISSLLPGVYFIKVLTNRYTVTEKLMIQR